MPDPIPVPLPPMPYPGYVTEEQRAKLAALWRQYWDYLMSIWYQPPNIVPPYPPPQPPPPPNPGPIAGDTTGGDGTVFEAAPEACHPHGWQTWEKVITERNIITRRVS